jgi:selenocysteine lyase/cysteine desulfurase
LEQSKARKEIPALTRMTYLDSAGAGLPPLSVTNAMKSLVDDWSRTGEHWEEWLLDVVKCRELFGTLIGAKGREVGVLPSASVALAAIELDRFLEAEEGSCEQLEFPDQHNPLAKDEGERDFEEGRGSEASKRGRPN